MWQSPGTQQACVPGLFVQWPSYQKSGANTRDPASLQTDDAKSEL
jgi:hypothetical protein